MSGLTFDELRACLKSYKEYLDGSPPSSRPYYRTENELRFRLRQHGINDLHGDPDLVDTIIKELVP